MQWLCMITKTTGDNSRVKDYDRSTSRIDTSSGIDGTKSVSSDDAASRSDAS